MLDHENCLHQKLRSTRHLKQTFRITRLAKRRSLLSVSIVIVAALCAAFLVSTACCFRAFLSLEASVARHGIRLERYSQNRRGADRTAQSSYSQGTQLLPVPDQGGSLSEGEVEDFGGVDAKLSPEASSMNLAKSIIGAGVLSLPSGAAQVNAAAEAAGVSGSVTQVASALLLLFFGALSAYGYYLVGEVCHRTGARTYQEAWSKTLGTELAWLPSVASLICCLTGAVACASVLGDIGGDMLKIVMPWCSVGPETILAATSGLILLPLCLLPSLAPLAFASFLGLIGVSLVAAVMIFRCLDGSYLPGGEFYDEAAATVVAASSKLASKQTGDSTVEVLGNLVMFAALMSNAFSAHFTAPVTFATMSEASKQQTEPAGRNSSEKLETFGTVTWTSFAFGALLFLAVTLAGVDTFGSGADPLILNSYAKSDPLASVARIGLWLCILFEYPLLERCFRLTLAEISGIPAEKALQPLAATVSVAFASAIACVPGLGLDKVSAIGGSLGCSLLIYVAPAMMMLKLRESEALKQGDRKETKPASSQMNFEALGLQSLAALGTVLGSLGVLKATGFSFSFL